MENRVACSFEHLPPTPLTVCSPVDWGWVPIGEFLVRWTDPETGEKHYLGNLNAKADKTNQDWTFVLGRKREQNEVLVYIHLPIKVSANSKGRRNIFFMIPIESLDVGASFAKFAKVDTPSTPLESEEARKAGLEEGNHVIWTSFSLKTPSNILMPIMHARKPMSERSQRLLRSLKSLSQATSFDIFLRHTAPGLDLMTSLLQLATNKHLHTPAIDYKATFHGRSWGRNEWNAYGVGDDIALKGPWNAILDELPPSYDEVVGSPIQEDTVYRSTNAVEWPPHPESWFRPLHPDFSSRSLPAHENIDGKIVPETDSDGPASPESEGPDENEEHGEGEDVPQGKSALSQLEDKDQDRQQLHQVHRGEPCQSRVRNGGDLHRKRKAREALSESEAILSPSPSLDHVVGKKKRKPKDKKPDSRGHKKAEKETPELTVAGKFIVSINARFTPSSIFRRGPKIHIFDDLQYLWLMEVITWFVVIWRRQHDAHIVYFGELELMCKAILAQDRDALDNARIRAMVAFVSSLPHEASSDGPFSCKLGERVHCIISFLYRQLGNVGDTFIVDELAALQYAVKAWKDVGGDDCPDEAKDDEWKQCEWAVRMQMCACLIVAIYQYVEIDHRSHEILAKEAEHDDSI